MKKKFLFLLLTSYTMLNAGVDIEIIKDKKIIKNYTFLNQMMSKEVETGYSEIMNIAENKSGSIRFSKVPYGVNLKIKQSLETKSKYSITLKYIMDDTNMKEKSKEVIVVNKFQKIPVVQLMDEKTKQIELNLLNNHESTKIELGNYVISIRGNNL
jgi:hypothetical protein